MSTINNTFSVRFNLANTLNLVLTDTTVSAPAGIVGFFTITQPDGSVRTGDVNSPDINAAGGSFTFALNRASDGGVQCGTYTIKYTVTAPGFFSSDFTRSFVFQYSPVSLVIEEDFDVFTPNLSVGDITNYAVSNFTAGSPTRSWTVSSTPTGTLTGSGATQSFAFGGQYYSANYNISLTSSILYSHSQWDWLTVQQSLSKSYSACIETPPGFPELVLEVSELKSELDAAINTCQTYDGLKKRFEYAQTLLSHIIDKARSGDFDNIFKDVNDLQIVLSNGQDVCNPTNLPIPAYNIGQLNSAAWGTIMGNIEEQTDLWNILQGLISEVIAGDGLTGGGSSGVVTLDVNPDNITVEVVNDKVQVKDGGITTAKIADGAVTGPKLSDGSVSTTKIVDGSVTDVKISGVSGSKVTGDISGNANSINTTLPISKGGTGGTTVVEAKTNLGLNNVDNTSDLNKPVSTATQAALDGKEDKANKSTNVNLGTSDTLYPTQNAVKQYVDNKVVTVADATETQKGIAELATQAETDAGTDDQRIVTPLKLKTLLDARVSTAGGELEGTYPNPTLKNSAVIDKILTSLDPNATGDVVNTDSIVQAISKLANQIDALENVRSIQTIIATAGQTVFNVVYTPGVLDVFLNGSKLNASEYVATNGTTVTITVPAVENDVLEFVIYAAGSTLVSTMTLSTSGFGDDITYDPVTNVLSIDKYDWMDLARGYDTITQLPNIATGEVYQYNYLPSTTFYRFIATDESIDAFYSDAALTNMLCQKKITI